MSKFEVKHIIKDSIPQRKFTAKMLASQRQLTSNLKDTVDFYLRFRFVRISSGTSTGRKYGRQRAAACLVFVIFMCIFYVARLICTLLECLKMLLLYQVNLHI